MSLFSGILLLLFVVAELPVVVELPVPELLLDVLYVVVEALVRVDAVDWDTSHASKLL